MPSLHPAEPPVTTPPPAGGRGDAIDPLDLLAVLGRHRRRLLLWPLLAGAVAAAVGLVLPKTWTGVTTLLPPQPSQSSAAALLGQLGPLAGAAGGALGLKGPGDLPLALLRSNAVADAVIERHGLKALYGEELQVDARKRLADATRLGADKGGVITIEVEARDPRLAADLANAYADELQRLGSTLAISEAAQRRLFFERQLGLAREKLAGLEARLRGAIDAGGLASVEAQGRAALETGARLRAQISAKEVQLGAMRAWAADGNPELRRAEGELGAMRRELARLESGPGGAARGDAAGGSGVENLALAREVKQQEAVVEALARQLELARVEESREAPLVQVLDRAAPPEKRTRPKRTLLALGAAAAALLLALLWTLGEDALSHVRADPARRSKLDGLREAWLPRRGRAARRGPWSSP